MNMSYNTNVYSPLQGRGGTSFHYTTNNIKDLNVYQQNNQWNQNNEWNQYNQLNQLNQLAYVQPRVQPYQPQQQLQQMFLHNPWQQQQGQNNFGLQGFGAPLIGNVNGSVNFFDGGQFYGQNLFTAFQGQNQVPPQYQLPPIQQYRQPQYQIQQWPPMQQQPQYQMPQWQPQQQMQQWPPQQQQSPWGNWDQLPSIPQPVDHDLPPIPPPYHGGRDGCVWGDPHFVGFDGEQFDVQGEEGKTYNIVTDKDYLFNARFDRFTNPGTTVMGEVYVQVGDQKLTFDKTGKATLNGVEMTKGQKVQFNDKEYAELNAQGELIVHSKEYESKFIANGIGSESAYIDYHVKLTEAGPFSDGVKGHGLLGQTADGKGEVKNGKQGSGAQGEGAIEGVYTDYEVKEGSFGTSFKFQAKKLTASDIREIKAAQAKLPAPAAAPAATVQ